jgi:hypothetical protein
LISRSWELPKRSLLVAVVFVTPPNEPEELIDALPNDSEVFIDGLQFLLVVDDDSNWLLAEDMRSRFSTTYTLAHKHTHTVTSLFLHLSHR